jgi:hypothetical protein
MLLLTRRRGIPPTLKEIGRHAEVRSNSPVLKHMEALMACGLVHRKGVRGQRCRYVPAPGLLIRNDDEVYVVVWQARDEPPVPVKVDEEVA